MKALTDRQREVLDYIAQFTEDNMYPPTVREIGTHFSISLRAVQDHIAALNKKGYVTLNQKRSRSLRVLKDERQKESAPFVARVPVVQTVPLAAPLLAAENVAGYVNCAEPLVRPGSSYFAIHVRGDSMREAGILDNDLAVFEQASAAADGQIVMAVVDNLATLRRYYNEGHQVRLQAANPDVQPMFCEAPRIVGLLASVFRTYTA